MRCDVATCWNRGRHDVRVLKRENDAGEDRPLIGYSHFILDPDKAGESSSAFVEGHCFGLCCGCYLRLVRERVRGGATTYEVWPGIKPIPWEEFWGYFKGWDPEPEVPNDEYRAKMEKTVWKGR